MGIAWKEQLRTIGPNVVQYNIPFTVSFILFSLEVRQGLMTKGCLTGTHKEYRFECQFGSIYPLGMAWNYPGISNRDIGAFYQSIRTFADGGVPFGSLNANTIEPFLVWIFRLMDAYEVKD